MRSLRKRRKLSPKFQRASLQLETLDPRLLLSVSANWLAQHDWIEPEIPADFIRPGYGHPDATFSDPAFWDVSDSYTVESEFACQSMILDDGDADFDISLAASSHGESVLYLDFDGERVFSRMGDFWLGGNYVDIPAYSLSDFGWGGREQESIEYIAEFVREDYAAFNISITTEQPSTDEYTTIYVGGNNDWFSPGSGVIGVATYDVGNRSASNYGFAFPAEMGIYYNYSGDNLRNFSEYLANLITHEAGHTFGANHVSDSSAIMNPYLSMNPRRVMFGQGQIPGSSSYQDTQSLLGANIGYAHGTDDYGDNYTEAEGGSENTIITGLLERRDDVDAFTFTAPDDGIVTIDIDTTHYGNLDSHLTLYRNGDMALIGQNDDYMGDLDSYCTLEVTQATQYTVLVSSSSSDSSGSYTLTLDYEPGEPVPELYITDSLGQSEDLAMDFPSIMARDQETASFQITNTGSADLVLSQLTSTGPFELSITSLPGLDGDDITIAPNNDFIVNVTFHPEEMGEHVGAIIIGSNDEENSLVTVMTTGSATMPTPDIDTPSTVYFLDQLRGYYSRDVLVITNDGQEDLIVSDITVTEPFSIISGFDGTPITVAPGQDTAVTLEVISGYRCTVDGVATVISNDPDDPVLDVNLSARIVGGVLTVHETSQIVDDSQIHFGNVKVNESGQYSITLENTGDAFLRITGLSTESPFSLDRALDVNDSSEYFSLSAGQSATINVSYAPNQMGAHQGVITIHTNDSENPVSQIQLYANAIGAVLDITEADGVNDGMIDTGTFQTGQNLLFDAWHITNNGTASTSVNLSLTEGVQYQLVSPSVITLHPGQSCTVQAQVQSNLARQVADTLVLVTEDAAVHNVSLVSDGYAIIERGQPYRFIDHTGDRVTVSINGDALAAVTIGGPLQPDIQSIEILNATGSETLRVHVKGGGTTQLGQIAGSDDLKAIIGKHVSLVGQGIDIEGSLTKLTLDNVLAGADIHFAAEEPASVKFGRVVGDSEITIDGALNRFSADHFLGGLLQCNGIKTMLINGHLNADVNVDSIGLKSLKIRQGDFDGNLMVNGKIETVKISNGDWLGSLVAQNNIDRIVAKQGTISGTIQAGYGIGKIVAGNINNAEINCLTGIDKINVSNNMLDSLVSVGFSEQAEEYKAAVSASGVDAVLGSLRIRGTFAGSTVAVGVAPDMDGSFIHGIANTASGIIGKVKIEDVNTDNGDNPFGLIAQNQIEKLKVNRQSLDANFQQDDFYINILNQ